ncbi:MAG: tetratricopeptide repeat protein [Planctomycetales bacterium]|nr:tetratricopeptide repeat protein [Planctomycetales bacterium]
MSLSGWNVVFRTEALWISAFLAAGAVGGLVYNWPDASVPDAQVHSDVAPTQVSETKLVDTSAEPVAAQKPVENIDVRDNPQVDLQPQEAPSVEVEKQQGIWNELAPESKRSQPIDFSVLKLGDGLLVGGNYVGAYQHYSKLWQRADLPVDTAVLIRLGLSAELAGLYDQAEQHYRSAIRVSESGSVKQLAGLLGTARVWEGRGQLDDAISLLSEMYLQYANDSQPELIRQSIVRQLADCLQKRLLLSPVVQQALQDEPMEYHWCPLVIKPILDLADLASLTPNPENRKTGLTLLQNPPGDVSLILFDAHLSGVAVLTVLSNLETMSGLTLNVTEKAKSELVGRLTNVESPVIPVSIMLDQMLESLRLTWSQTNGMVTIMHRDELTERDSASFDLARVQRMLQQVQLNFSNGVERTAAMMNDGNNARLSGGWDVAADKYRAARESSPTNELSAKLFFNEASLDLVRGEKLNSLHACYLALDQTLSTTLQAHVYAMIGELELEFGQPGKAVTAASRGLRRADDPKVISRTVMTLARAYLLADDPFSANAVLFDASDDLTTEPIKRLASVFGTYARFQHVQPKQGLQDEGQRLVMALAALDPKDVTTFADALIVSDAFASVGLRSQAIDSLQLALDIAPPGYWNEKIRLQLAETYYQASELARANETVESFGSVSADLLPTVLFLHASIQLDMGQLEQTEAICRRILRMNVDEAMKAKALDKLGQVLQRSGQHYAAALCFAGLLPDPVDSSSDDDSVVAGQTGDAP